ncbi:hypothetical protein RMR16_025115 (plasmid) [Agrobacterium sp. rho-13.3]|uniref:hypothetical protein n=1 Tax=Agrobacterium sp. rho-13.3 TaxID=3072980 RepID=UPI002A13C7C3|nr:hypothetical protein [Agrobacterium sp. rho-13.3]MDX8310233.1 hypothetical protein [Agrobacterium sp. rho-13.3]
MLLNEKFLKSLTIRSMQALGGLIVHHFFSKQGNINKDIEILVLHQLSILIKDNLLEWENMGATLPINGRGDPVPEDFKGIDKKLNGIASQAIDYSTEIGLCSLYTSDHRESLFFLLKLLSVTDLAEKNIIDATTLDLLPKGSGWGSTISTEEHSIIVRNII